jgi:hypothetical protein
VGIMIGAGVAPSSGDSGVVPFDAPRAAEVRATTLGHRDLQAHRFSALRPAHTSPPSVITARVDKPGDPTRPGRVNHEHLVVGTGAATVEAENEGRRSDGPGLLSLVPTSIVDGGGQGK